VSLPGLQHALDQERVRELQVAGRSWLARWLDRTRSWRPAAVAARNAGAEAVIVWMATPVHLIAASPACTSIAAASCDSMPTTKLRYVADFQRVFHDSGFQLQPLASGDF